MKINKKALVELAKSFGRFIWFGLLGLIVTFLTALVSAGGITDATIAIGSNTLNVGVILVFVIGFIAKAIDRYVHANENITANGIAPSFLQK